MVIPEGGKLEMDQSYEDIVIKVYFYKDLEIEKEFFVGRTFIMAEGGKAVIGEGIITEVIGEEANMGIKY